MSGVYAIDMFGQNIDYLGQTPRKGDLPFTRGADAAEMSRCIIDWGDDEPWMLGYVIPTKTVKNIEEAEKAIEKITATHLNQVFQDGIFGDYLYVKVVILARLGRIALGETPEQHNLRMKLRYKRKLRTMY